VSGVGSSLFVRSCLTLTYRCLDDPALLKFGPSSICPSIPRFSAGCTTLSWMCYLSPPSALRLLQRSDQRQPHVRLPSFSDLSILHWTDYRYRFLSADLEAVVHEILRLSGVAPVTERQGSSPVSVSFSPSGRAYADDSLPL
jgi:hypothetical protein